MPTEPNSTETTYILLLLIMLLMIPIPCYSVITFADDSTSGEFTTGGQDENV